MPPIRVVEVLIPGVQGPPGVVQSIVAGDNVEVDDTDPANPIVSSTGGGDVLHIATTVHFDTPGLSSPSGAIPGFTVYTASAGDILLDGWVDVDPEYTGAGWDVTAFGDFYLASTVAGGSAGTFAATASAIDMADTGGDQPHAFAGNSTVLSGPSTQAQPTLRELNFFDVFGGAGTDTRRRFPARFTTSETVVFVVSDNGLSIGNDPNATEGSATIHLLVIPA